MIFTREIWAKVGSGYEVYDCAVRSRNRQCFIMAERQEGPHRDPLPRTRFLFTYNNEDEPEERCFYRGYSHFDFANVAFTRSPAANYVAVDIRGNVYSYDDDREGEEAALPKQLIGTNLEGVILKTVRVGDSIYSVGGPRRVYRHTGVGSWRDMTVALAIPRDFIEMKPNMADFYWADLSGFSEADMYAAGGAGEVWRYDGRRWTRLSFVSNERLVNICCAGDGNVYVGGNMGSLYTGRGDKWRKLVDGELSVSFKDVAWFAGRLWCGSDFGLWELKGNSLVRADVPPEVQLVAGAIDVSPDGGLMLTAGPDGAALFDGESWEVLFSRHDLE